MTPYMAGPKAKLDRASEHLKTLYDTVRRLENGEGYAAIPEVDSETGDHLWRMRIDPAAPMRLGVLVGDVAHNLRSCLDHLAWQLALTIKPNPRDSTEFPIYRDPGPVGNGYDPRGRKKIRDLPCVAQKLIESMQPYHRPNPFESYLWRLYFLNNTDKHRYLFKTLVQRSGGILHWDTAIGTQSSYPEIIMGALTTADDGDILLRMPATAAAHLEKESEPEFFFSVTLDIPPVSYLGPWYVCPTLQQIHDAIRDDLLPQFERFFTNLGPGF